MLLKFELVYTFVSRLKNEILKVFNVCILYSFPWSKRSGRHRGNLIFRLFSGYPENGRVAAMPIQTITKSILISRLLFRILSFQFNAHRIALASYLKV